jgi:hypothetical protein
MREASQPYVEGGASKRQLNTEAKSRVHISCAPYQPHALYLNNRECLIVTFGLWGGLDQWFVVALTVAGSYNPCYAAKEYMHAHWSTTVLLGHDR